MTGIFAFADLGAARGRPLVERSNTSTTGLISVSSSQRGLDLAAEVLLSHAHPQTLNEFGIMSDHLARKMSRTIGGANLELRFLNTAVNFGEVNVCEVAAARSHEPVSSVVSTPNSYLPTTTGN